MTGANHCRDPHLYLKKEEKTRGQCTEQLTEHLLTVDRTVKFNIIHFIHIIQFIHLRFELYGDLSRATI